MILRSKSIQMYCFITLIPNAYLHKKESIISISQENPDKVGESLFKPILYFGIIFMVIGKLLCIYNYEYHFGDYYHLGPGGTMGLMGCIILIFWIFYQIERVLPKNNYIRILFFYCSENVTAFYVFQWVLIYWLLAFVKFSVYNEFTVLVIMLGVNLGVFVLLFIFNTYLVSKKSKNQKAILQDV